MYTFHKGVPICLYMWGAVDMSFSKEIPRLRFAK